MTSFLLITQKRHIHGNSNLYSSSAVVVLLVVVVVLLLVVVVLVVVVVVLLVVVVVVVVVQPQSPTNRVQLMQLLTFAVSESKTCSRHHHRPNKLPTANHRVYN